MPFETRRGVFLEAGRRVDLLGTAPAPKGIKEMSNLYAGASSKSRMVPSWDPDRLHTAWRRVSKDNAVAVGPGLAEALSILGHPYPLFDVVDRILARDCSGRASLDLEDFLHAVSTYEAYMENKREAAFESMAGGDDEVLSKDAITILQQLGVPAMTGVAEELEQVGTDIDFEVFDTVYLELMDRAGLTNDEHKRLQLRFEELEDSSGTITAQECLAALSWHESLIQLAGGPGVMKALVEETLERQAAGRLWLSVPTWTKVAAAAQAPDAGVATPNAVAEHIVLEDQTTRVTSTAFMAAATVLHSRIVDGLRRTLERLGLDEDSVPTDSLLAVFEELGFVGVTSDMDSFLHACDMQGESELTFFEFFTIVFRYCQADGVTEAESKDINGVFARMDQDCSGTLEAGEIGPVIRWLGYHPTQFRVWDFMEEFGVDFHSHIDALEFRRLAAKYKSLRLKEVRKIFLSQDRAVDDHTIHVKELRKLLVAVGYEPTREEILDLVEEAGGRNVHIDFHGFKRLELTYRRRVQEAMARLGGFTDGEVERFHMYFKMRNGGGPLSGSAMRQLFFEIFPDKSKDLRIHTFIAKVMRESHVENGSMCGFDQFMELVAKIQEETDRSMVIHALRLRQDLGLTGVEVKQFRDLFLLADEDASGDLCFEELCSMFTQVVSLDMATKREIMAQVMELGDQSGGLDFWGFLEFMHAVQSKRWRGLRFSPAS